MMQNPKTPFLPVRRCRCILFLLAALFCACHVAPAMAAEEGILYEGDSIYHHITIQQVEQERCMLFGRYRDLRQTCINLKDPADPVIEYAAMMFAGFLFQPQTERVCLIGLGGGYIPTVFRLYLPQVRLDTVEVDPLVHKLAKTYFAYETPSGQRLIVDDGRQFLKKTGDRYDQIWVDAFNSDYVPAHMTTQEFLKLARSRLRPTGVVAQNLFRSNRLFDAQVTTYRTVFPHVVVFQGKDSDNCIIFASEQPPPAPSQLKKTAERFKGKLGRIDLERQAEKRVAAPVIRKAPVLTDDFNPANLLRMEK